MAQDPASLLLARRHAEEAPCFSSEVLVGRGEAEEQRRRIAELEAQVGPAGGDSLFDAIYISPRLWRGRGWFAMSWLAVPYHLISCSRTKI